MPKIEKMTALIVISIITATLAITVHEVNDFIQVLEITNTEKLNAERLLRQSAEDNASAIEKSADTKIDETVTEINKFNYGA